MGCEGKSPAREAATIQIVPGECARVDLPKAKVRFGIFEVDFASGELRRQGIKVKLQEQPFQVLAALLERPGEVLTREELQQRLWPDTTVDFDRGLNKAINRLREAVGDSAENPRFIETLPQRGYRFLAPVEAVRAEAVSAPAGTEHASRRISRRGVLAIGGGLAASAVFSLSYFRPKSKFRRIESIAVLPLENLSGDPAEEYFSEGMTDELIGEIARIGSLRVISRTSVMQYKGGARKSLPEIARDLDVGVILEGTVTRAGGKVRISAQLIRAEDDNHIWSARYERNLSDVFAIQSEVAREVARQIQIELAPAEEAGLARARAVKTEAHEAYLKGSFFLYRGIANIGKSLEYFGQALEIDSNYAEAQAGSAEALIWAGIFGQRPPAEAFPQARRAALRALELDESNASAHNALADVIKGYDWDMAGAEREYQRALQLNPSHLLTRLWYAEYLARVKKFDAALEESSRALALDPVSPISHNNRAMLFFRASRYEEAIRLSGQALELDPHFVNAFWWLGMSYAGIGDYTSAVTSLTEGAGLSGGPVFPALLGHVHGRAGKKDEALARLQEITAQSERHYVSPMNFAIIHAGLGDADSTFQWLEKAYEERSPRIHELPAMYFDRFRGDSRYPILIRRIGLPI